VLQKRSENPDYDWEDEESDPFIYENIIDMEVDVGMDMYLGVMAFGNHFKIMAWDDSDYYYYMTFGDRTFTANLNDTVVTP
jgi:hypothetical protein